MSAALPIPTLVVGAGPAGLAVGACLRRAGLPCLILEQSDRVAASWHGHYDRLHLHTDKAHSVLPFVPFPRECPRYPSRAQVIAYLEAYARHFQLESHFGQQALTARLSGDRWQVETPDRLYQASNLVLATGYNREPIRPAWPGQAAFGGSILHSSAYRHGEPFRNQTVLVVGFGNSGGEIANVKMPRLDKDILPGFSADDVHKLLDAAKNPRHREVVLALIDTGCRAQEFINLNVGDVDIKTGTVKIRQGKGRNDRVTFLGAKSRRLVLKWLMSREAPKPEDPLWTSDNTGERLTYWGLSLLLRRLGKAAQVENCHPHTFRRTCALWNLRSGMNVYALQQIMGHGSLEILRKYLALAEQDLVEAHRKHGAVDNVL